MVEGETELVQLASAQLAQLQLWQTHVCCGDGVERVLGDGGVVEGGEEAVGVAVVEGAVEVGD